MNDSHKKFLLKAHSLANTNFGKTFPNPSVGCLIVKKNKIISKGVTASAGRPHAEEIALKKAGKNSVNSTMYVTLEPCNHQSYNGSCTDQIINSGISKIFISKFDPDPRTNKKSIKKFIKEGLEVNVGLLSDKTYSLNKFFFESIKNNRPYVKLKMAISSDKKIAWKDYSSKWISNKLSRAEAHKIRYRSQAILTTSKTVIKDNPRFTVRHNKKIIKYLPVIIIDQSLKTPLDSYLIKTLSKRRIIIFTSKKGTKYEKLKFLGCEIYLLKKIINTNDFNLSTIMSKIFSLKIKDILIESGGIFFTKLISKSLIDEIHIFKAPFKIGEEGKSMLIKKNIEEFQYQEISKKKFGKDVYCRLIKK